MSTVRYIGSGSWVSGTSYQFTTTQQVPAGVTGNFNETYLSTAGSRIPQGISIGGNSGNQNQSAGPPNVATFRYLSLSGVSAGSTISVSVPATGVSSSLAAAFMISGFTNILDTSASAQATGSGTAVSITTSHTTATSYEVLMFTCMFGGGPSVTFTPTTPGMTTLYQFNVGGSSNIFVGSLIAASVANYTFTGTISSTQNWSAILDCAQCNAPKGFPGGAVIW